MEEERPYHVQGIYDLEADYSPEHFRFAIGECRKVIAQLIAEDQSSDQQIARVHILRYLDLQLSRATGWADGDADLMAIVLRSQIELRGWAEFVSGSVENAARFLNDEVVTDIVELKENMEKAFPGVTPLPPSLKGKRINPERIGQTVDYDFKLCSKLIHPSALMLNHPEATISSQHHKAYLAVQVLLYAWVIVDRFHNLVWRD